MAESSVPVLDIEKIPLQDSIAIPGPSRKARQRGTAARSLPVSGQIRAAAAPRRDNLGPPGRFAWEFRPQFRRFAGYFALNRRKFSPRYTSSWHDPVYFLELISLYIADNQPILVGQGSRSFTGEKYLDQDLHAHANETMKVVETVQEGE